MKITMKINWTKSVKVLVLMCVVFSFSAMAQTTSDKPMEAKTLAALVEELKGVVSRTAPDKNEAKLVGEKWDKRKDLAGKTKSEVIELLFEDVRSVIKDSGTQYQIYSMFSFYKTLPDESPSDEGKKTKGEMPRSELVSKLVGLTFPLHPFIFIGQLDSSMKVEKNAEEEEEERKDLFAEFEEALKKNDKLTPEHKAFVRANFDQLKVIVDKLIEDEIKTKFSLDKFVKEGLQKSYASNFSSEELTDLITYFEGNTGQKFLKTFTLLILSEPSDKNEDNSGVSVADKAEHDKFINTALGKKFIFAYKDENFEYVESKVNDDGYEKSIVDEISTYLSENLNKIFNKFVEENYKK